MSRISFISTFFVLSLSTLAQTQLGFASQDYEEERRESHGSACQGRTDCAQFELDCLYENLTAPSPIRHCEVKSSFTKRVTLQGGEVADRSDTGSYVNFSIRCDGVPWVQFTGLRFTDLLGTRIESVSPTAHYPIFDLPRGSLHRGNHVSPSTLQVVFDLDRYDLRGQCSIRTLDGLGLSSNLS